LSFLFITIVIYNVDRKCGECKKLATRYYVFPGNTVNIIYPRCEKHGDELQQMSVKIFGRPFWDLLTKEEILILEVMAC
jgi:hypothetical protein